MNKIRIATQGITDEMRGMKIGETVRFPMSKYNYNSIRSTPSGPLVNDRVQNGMEWKTRINKEEKCTDVTRIA